ncbi:MAG: hypothetical protein CMJ20_01110 [Phycisphaeraceae bacterium]|nr:hypothetical protein [Phycisphaeraceae bacterium]
MAMSILRFPKVLIAIWVLMIALSSATTTWAETLTFQQGANGYNRAQDTSIRWGFTTNFGDTAGVDTGHAGDVGSYESWATSGGRTTVLEVGNFLQSELGTVTSGVSSPEAGPTYRYSRMFIRFRDVFGATAGQIPADADIKSATLKLYNTEDLGAEGSAGGAFKGDTVIGPGNVELDNIYAMPKLNSGTIAIYPMLHSITWGFDDGVATKGRVTAKEKRRGKVDWEQGSYCGMPDSRSAADYRTPNDGYAMAFNCGPADKGDPDLIEDPSDPNSIVHPHNYDSTHSGAVEIFQDANPGFKEFDVTGLLDFVTGDGVFITALSPTDAVPTMEVNYGNAYRSSEFGDVYDSDGNLTASGSVEDIATRPMLVIELGSSMIPGDANGDGIIDVADLGVVGANFGSTNALPGDGDFNGDGQVDVADLGIVGANWTAAASSSAALVPEPVSGVTLTVGLGYLGFRRRNINVELR